MNETLPSIMPQSWSWSSQIVDRKVKQILIAVFCYLNFFLGMISQKWALFFNGGEGFLFQWRGVHFQLERHPLGGYLLRWVVPKKFMEWGQEP